MDIHKLFRQDITFEPNTLKDVAETKTEKPDEAENNDASIMELSEANQHSYDSVKAALEADGNLSDEDKAALEALKNSFLSSQQELEAAKAGIEEQKEGDIPQGNRRSLTVIATTDFGSKSIAPNESKVDEDGNMIISDFTDGNSEAVLGAYGDISEGEKASILRSIYDNNRDILGLDKDMDVNDVDPKAVEDAINKLSQDGSVKLFLPTVNTLVGDKDVKTNYLETDIKFDSLAALGKDADGELSFEKIEIKKDDGSVSNKDEIKKQLMEQLGANYQLAEGQYLMLDDGKITFAGQAVLSAILYDEGNNGLFDDIKSEDSEAILDRLADVYIAAEGEDFSLTCPDASLSVLMNHKAAQGEALKYVTSNEGGTTTYLHATDESVDVSEMKNNLDLLDKIEYEDGYSVKQMLVDKAMSSAYNPINYAAFEGEDGNVDFDAIIEYYSKVGTEYGDLLANSAKAMRDSGFVGTADELNQASLDAIDRLKEHNVPKDFISVANLAASALNQVLENNGELNGALNDNQSAYNMLFDTDIKTYAEKFKIDKITIEDVAYTRDPNAKAEKAKISSNTVVHEPEIKVVNKTTTVTETITEEIETTTTVEETTTVIDNRTVTTQVTLEVPVTKFVTERETDIVTETVIDEQTVTMTQKTTETVVEDHTVTNTVTEQVYVHDTETVTEQVYVHDTETVTERIIDKVTETATEVVTVRDTETITVRDTETVYVNNTETVTVRDTETVYVHDTTTVTVTCDPTPEIPSGGGGNNDNNTGDAGGELEGDPTPGVTPDPTPTPGDTDQGGGDEGSEPEVSETPDPGTTTPPGEGEGGETSDPAPTPGEGEGGECGPKPEVGQNEDGLPTNPEPGQETGPESGQE